MLHISAPLARAGMRRLSGALLTSFLALVGCGGGGDGSTPPPPSSAPLIHGVAANGRALDGTLTVEDSAGHLATARLDGGAGEFSVDTEGLVAPFMLKATSADGQVVLYSATPAAGRVNVNPLTNLGLLRLAAKQHLEGPAALWTDPASFKARLTQFDLHSAAVLSMARLMPEFVRGLPDPTAPHPLGPPVYDPYVTPYAIGDDVDRLIDAYPIDFSRDASGRVVATQTNAATGFSSQVARSDTAAQVAQRIEILGETTVAPERPVQLRARATFADGTTQDIPADWYVQFDGTIDADGRFTPPAVTIPTQVYATALWFDGAHQWDAVVALNLVPVHQPQSLTITAPDAPIPALSDFRLEATVHWYDGVDTKPIVNWRLAEGSDTLAVRSIERDGILHAGAPDIDTNVTVVATFTEGDLTLESRRTVTIAQAHKVTDATLSGLPFGQSLQGGDSATLIFTASWNDGTVTSMPAQWSIEPMQTNVGTATIQANGVLSTTAFDAPPGTDPAFYNDVWIARAFYDVGDGTRGEVDVDFSVRPRP